jgi:hypothetical protein
MIMNVDESQMALATDTRAGTFNATEKKTGNPCGRPEVTRTSERASE